MAEKKKRQGTAANNRIKKELNGGGAKRPAKKKKAVSIELPVIESMSIEIIGTTPLLVHAFSAKAKKQIEDKQQKKGKAAKAARDPQAEFEAAKYYTASGEDAGLSVWFKKSAIRGAKHCGLVMKDAVSSFFVEGEKLPLDFETCTMREDTVRLNGGSADLRYRPEYTGWRVNIDITFNSNLISADQLIACFTAAGFGVGVGDWRPERGGGHGRFRLGEIVLYGEVEA